MTDESKADLLEGWKALEDATEPYEEALAYFKGTAAERFANARIRQLVEDAGQTYHFRLAAIPVKVMAKRCRIATVTSDRAGVTERLEEIRLANQAAIYEPLVMRKMFMFGDAYAMVWPVEVDADQVEEEGEAPEDVQSVGVEITYQSPLHCRTLYDSEDGRRPRFTIRRWLERSPLGERANVWRAEVWYGDRLEPWISRPGASGGNAEDWSPYAEDEEGNRVPAEKGANWPVSHDFGEIPFKHARTDLPYGTPAHEAAYGPQDAITKAITTQVVVDIEAHGWPERWRLLDDQRLLEASQDQVNWGDSGDAPTADPSIPVATARRRGAGLEHTYAGTKGVGEYTPPDPAALINPVEHWTRLMSVVTETPLYELDQTVQVSGVSREKADAPLRAKEKEAKSYLEGFWAGVYSLAVRMSGIPEPGTISVQWTPPEVTMDSDWWATARIRMEMGVPIKEILAEANYLPDQIKKWLDEQGEEMALLQRITTLERLGAAIQTLGVGVQMGVLDQGTVNGLVERIVGEMKDPPGQSGGQGD